jgi:membrane protease YdiL (CAAX protease family)
MSRLPRDTQGHAEMIRLSERQRATIRWIFTGSCGIRAGWSILIFLICLAVPSFVLNLILSKLLHMHRPKELSPFGLLLTETVLFAFIMAATWVMARIEKRPVLHYGLAGRRPVTHFLAGFAGGFLCLSALVGVLAGGGYLVFDGEALHGAAVLQFGFVWLVAFALVGFSEETLFRGYMQTTLTRGMGFWPGAVVLSLLFGAAHVKNNGESVLGITEVVAAGLVFCLLLRVSGSLWLGIGFHAAWDWAQTFLYGTPDSGYVAFDHFLASHAAGNVLISGGSAGPEGSTLAPPMMLGGLLVVLLVCRLAGLFDSSGETGPGRAALPRSSGQSLDPALDEGLV